jgi:hypothetical protein
MAINEQLSPIQSFLLRHFLAVLADESAYYARVRAWEGRLAFDDHLIAHGFDAKLYWPAMDDLEERGVLRRLNNMYDGPVYLDDPSIAQHLLDREQQLDSLVFAPYARGRLSPLAAS